MIVRHGALQQPDLVRGLEDGGREPGLDVPLDVAVEEVDARVVGAVAEHDVAALVDLDGVATHGDRGRVLADEVGVVGRVGGRPRDDLEGVPVEVPGVVAVVVVD